MNEKSEHTDLFGREIIELDYGEIDDVLEIFHTEVIKHGPEAELSFLSKEITEDRINWHREHRKYLESIEIRLIEILKRHKQQST